MVPLKGSSGVTMSCDFLLINAISNGICNHCTLVAAMVVIFSISARIFALQKSAASRTWYGAAGRDGCGVTLEAQWQRHRKRPHDVGPLRQNGFALFNVLRCLKKPALLRALLHHEHDIKECRLTIVQSCFCLRWRQCSNCMGASAQLAYVVRTMIRNLVRKNAQESTLGRGKKLKACFT